MTVDLILFYKREDTQGVRNVRHSSTTKESSSSNNVNKSIRLKAFSKADTNDFIFMERILNKDRNNSSDTRIQSIISL